MQQKDFDFLAIDFETYYDDEYSLTNMDPWHYVFHEKFDAYLVAIHGAEGPVFIGHPSKCDWSVVQGKVIAMHNAGFDLLVYRRLQQDGIIPASASIDALDVWDTIDMAGFLGMSKRNLAQCSKYLLGEEMSKAVRAGMKGRTYNDAVAAGDLEALLAYGGKDAEVTYWLADKFRDTWPDNERLISNLNREAGIHGVAIDIPLLTEALRTVKAVRQTALNDMPWVDEGEKPLSPKAIREQGRKDGIPVPGSLAKTSPEVQKWEAKYVDEYPWVRAVREFRSVNIFLKRLGAIKANLRDDGTMGFQIKYHGAGPGRFSGGSAWEEAKGNKFNMLNQPRDPMFGVDLRNVFTARPGHKLIIPDYAQIEARLLLWVVQDNGLIDLLVQEGNLYQAYAKKAGTFSGPGSLKKTDKSHYNHTKAQVLSLGYGCAWKTFQVKALADYGVDLSDEEAQQAVLDYRRDNPRVVNYWRDHQMKLQFSITHADPTHEILLPSGRVLTYYDPRYQKNKFGRPGAVVKFQRDGVHRNCYGGLLTENTIQATARDILCDAWVSMHNAGYHGVLWNVYDEFIYEVPEDEAEDTAKEIAKIMVSSSPWCCEPEDIRFVEPSDPGDPVEVHTTPKKGGCPLGVEYIIADYYQK